HFKYVHGATVDPVLLDWEADGPFFLTTAGWPTPAAKSPGGMALKINSVSCGVGGTYSVFEGSTHYRLAFFTTPVEDETSYLFYSIWWPRDSGDDSPAVPDHYRARAEKEVPSTPWDGLDIWLDR